MIAPKSIKYLRKHALNDNSLSLYGLMLAIINFLCAYNIFLTSLVRENRYVHFMSFSGSLLTVLFQSFVLLAYFSWYVIFQSNFFGNNCDHF